MLRVLIVDTDAPHLERLADGLRLLPDIAVAATSDLNYALQVVEMAAPDLVLAALELDGRSGLEIVQALQSRGGILPEIVFMTDLPKDASADVRRFQGSGMLVKPVMLADVRKLVSAHRPGRDWAANRKLPEHSLSNVLDLVRVAMLSGHCVRISIEHRGDRVGEIVVRDGGIWSVHDRLGVGEWAFCRVLQSPGVAWCEPIPSEQCGECNVGSVDLEVPAPGSEPDPGPAPRIGSGVYGAVSPEVPTDVFDAALRRSGPYRSTEALLDRLYGKESSESEAPPAGNEPPAAEPAAPEPLEDVDDNVDDNAERERKFHRALDRGIDALLAKDYEEALDAMRLADSIRPGHTIVTTNLQRLRELGYGGD